MFARQYRETSRAQASCPCFCCAEAADVIKTRGMTKRILLICYAFALGNCNQDASITLSSEESGKRLRRIDASVPESQQGRTDYCAASLPFCAARSRSITVRQPELRSE